MPFAEPEFPRFSSFVPPYGGEIAQNCCVVGSQWLRDRVGAVNGAFFVPLEGSCLNRGKNQSEHRRHLSVNHSYAEIYCVITGERRIRGDSSVSITPDDFFLFLTFCSARVDEEYLVPHIGESLVRFMILDLWRSVKCCLSNGPMRKDNNR